MLRAGSWVMKLFLCPFLINFFDMFHGSITHSFSREMMLLSGGSVKSASGTFFPITDGRHTNLQAKSSSQCPTCDLPCLSAKSQQEIMTLWSPYLTQCPSGKASILWSPAWHMCRLVRHVFKVHVESQSRPGQHQGPSALLCRDPNVNWIPGMMFDLSCYYIQVKLL